MVVSSCSGDCSFCSQNSHTGTAWRTYCNNQNANCFNDDSTPILYTEIAGDLFRFELKLGRRFDMETYYHFLDHFGPALIGVKAWKNQRGAGSIDSILTASDESFLLAVIDGNYKRWDYELDTANDPGDENDNDENKPVSINQCQ